MPEAGKDLAASSLPENGKLTLKSVKRNVLLKKLGLGNRLRLSRLLVGWTDPDREKQLKALEDTYKELLGLATDLTPKEIEDVDPKELIVIAAAAANLNGFGKDGGDGEGPGGKGEGGAPA